MRSSSLVRRIEISLGPISFRVHDLDLVVADQRE